MTVSDTPSRQTHPGSNEVGWLSRERAVAAALVVVTGAVFYTCCLLAAPFLSAIAWSGALAVVAHPMHRAILNRLGRPNLSAAAAVLMVALVVVGPSIFIVQQLVQQLAVGLAELQANTEQVVERFPQMRPFLDMLHGGEVPDEAKQAMAGAVGGVPKFVGGSLWFGGQLLITFFMLFYFFRDRRAILGGVMRSVPLTTAEAGKSFQRVEDTVFATIYGSLAVAIVQGTLGGVMFWLLGLSTPLLWGVVMALLATVPMLGTFVVWFPAAVFLALEGDWIRALILIAWGSVAIALVDNFLYPFLVGKRLRLHPLLVFIAVVGGISLFGAAGVVLGPVVLAVAEALLDVWRTRTEHGGTVEQGAEVDSSSTRCAVRGEPR